MKLASIPLRAARSSTKRQGPAHFATSDTTGASAAQKTDSSAIDVKTSIICLKEAGIGGVLLAPPTMLTVQNVKMVRPAQSVRMAIARVCSLSAWQN